MGFEVAIYIHTYILFKETNKDLSYTGSSLIDFLSKKPKFENTELLKYNPFFF